MKPKMSPMCFSEAIPSFEAPPSCVPPWDWCYVYSPWPHECRGWETGPCSVRLHAATVVSSRSKAEVLPGLLPTSTFCFHMGRYLLAGKR
jgi:hypothetical protein